MSIFSQIFKDDLFNNFEDRINKLFDELPTIEREVSVDTLSGDFISSFLEGSSKDEFDKILQGVSVARDRLERYAIYDEAYKYVPILKRMMRVYISNILQKNPITGVSILIQESGRKLDVKDESSIIDKAKKFADKCINDFDILTRLKYKILPNQLVYGDCFLEVVDINQEIKKKDPEAASSVRMTTLFETELFNISAEVDQIKSRVGNHLSASHVDQLLFKIANLLADVEVVSFPENSKDENKKNSNDKTTDFSDIVLRIHKPHNIIVLQTTYGSIIGYLEVSRDEFPQIFNLTQSLSTLVGRITSILGKDHFGQDNVTDRIVRFIVKQALDKAQNSNSFSFSGSEESIDDVLKNLDAETYNFIKRLIVEQGLHRPQSQSFFRIRIRFIPASRMIRFTIPSNEYDPYGISFIDNLVFQCKLYILNQLSNVIIKLSRAAPVRKWTIDTGSTQMHSNLIQKLKRELYNTRVTLDDIASFKSIPKILSDFKDMFILSKGGAKPIDVEIQSHGDPTVRTADLEDARREIMSLSGIPPAYLGYADVIELREQLVHTNISFATEIIDMQENITLGLTKFVDVVADILKLNFKPSDYVQIKLIPPIVLMLQLIEMTLSSIGNINGIFQTLQTPIDPYFFLKQYVPYIDWEAFKAAAEEHVRTQQTKKTLETVGGNIGGEGGE